ncbi:MAG: hypothetical protein JWR25_2351 [Noviherbaspirillum sp.]|nr:hypothetical protein [Noviherbaspirillum sp.]
MEDSLTIDEYDALEQIGRGTKRDTVSACVARNAKRLSGLKYVAYGKNGTLSLTEKGTMTLFVKRCIDGLRAVALNPGTQLNADIAAFLNRKGHIVPSQSAPEGFDITDKGRESLADIDSRQSS